MHHYTYQLHCTDTDQLYIGVRSSKTKPQNDFYWSSSKTVKAMMKRGLRFTKTVLAEWDTREEAVSHEILLHECFDVARNIKFLNNARQTSIGFDCAGNKQTHAKISATLKGKPAPWNSRPRPDLAERNKQGMSAVTRLKISNSRIGIKDSEETKLKKSLSRLGKKRGPYRKK